VKIKVIQSSWMAGNGYRLDTNPYLGGALEAKVLLEALALPKQFIRDLVSPEYGGIYFAGRASVQWVESSDLGVPFLRGKDIQLADLSESPFISKQQVKENPSFLIKKGMTLITRSGTIGKTGYVRADMDGMATSDPLRVVPDPQKIAPGYLYAYLSSKFGVPLVASGASGAIIQHLDPNDIEDIPVPRLGVALEHEIHILIERAAELRTKATLGIHNARKKLHDYFGKPPTLKLGTRHPYWAGHAITSKQVAEIGRLDTLFFNPLSCDLDEWLVNHSAGNKKLGEIAEVFDVPPFKHIYVGPEEGTPFFTSADLFDLDRVTDKYLSRGQTKGLQKYVLEEGWVLIARSGQLNGNIGLPQLVDSGMAETTASDHVIRIVPHDEEFSPGYLYAYLSLPEWRYSLIQRSATGASIPALWPVYLNHIRILRPPTKLNKEVDVQVRKCLEMRVAATKLDTEARERLEEALKESAN